MREYVATLTQRGQITVPAEVRRVLGAKPRGKLAFQVEGDQVRLVPAAFTLETAYGSVPPTAPPEDFKRIEQEAKDEHVERVVRKMKRDVRVHR
jgi:AbrB family looped-hinge helix DNA binding protein